VRLPIESAAGFSITAVGPRRPPRLPLKLVEANVAVTPFDVGVRLAGRFTLGPPPRRVSQRQLGRVVSAVAPYLRDWRPEGVLATHVGLRPATPDSLPVIGELPGRPGVYAATGHGMLGLTLAPGTAAEILHQVTAGGPTEIGTAFAVDRFGQARVGTAWARSADIGS
jgi:D-amino-acid dehydrogenase